mmetsp:Transcript_9787/g.39738  ORF Transcript_9787/g.39738 Transcript_9787/m.39738 type:complete len:115 (+) Transcript_9787:64-408(+)
MCKSSFNMVFTVVAVLLGVALTNMLVSNPTTETKTVNDTSSKLAMEREISVLRKHQEAVRGRPSEGAAREKAGGLFAEEPEGEVLEYLDYEQFQRFLEFQEYLRYKEKHAAAEP